MKRRVNARLKAEAERARNENFKEGDVVDYHSVIGGDITSRHTIRVIGNTPSSDEPVAWLTDKAGCVALAALTRPERIGHYENSKFLLGK